MNNMPGIPRKGRGLSSTTSLTIDIMRPMPCIAGFSVDVFTPTLLAYLQEIGTSQTFKPLLWTARRSSMLAAHAVLRNASQLLHGTFAVGSKATLRIAYVFLPEPLLNFVITFTPNCLYAGMSAVPFLSMNLLPKTTSATPVFNRLD